MTGFVLCAAVMTLIALSFIVVPLLRAHREADPLATRRLALDRALASGALSTDEHAAKLAAFTPELAIDANAPPVRSRGGYVALLLTVLLLPAIALFTYAKVGRPQALDTTETQPIAGDAGAGVDMDQAVAGLAAKLEQDPNDGKGWALLGRAYQSMQKAELAMDAFKHARALLPDDPDLMADYAQALVMAGGKDFSGEPKQLLDRALTIQPDNQRALWLRGVAEYQAGEHAASIATWTRLLGLLPHNSPVATSVQAQIDEARSKAGLPAVEASVQSSPQTAESSVANSPRLTVSVSLDPTFADQVEPTMTVFVFARAVSGPPMPLAIQRLTVSQLPTTITLDDSNGMLPNMKLSDFPQVVIGARISRSGDPLAKSGDWQTLSDPVETKRKETIVLTIDQIVP
ncbi:MAG: c-type cytochrome biogenesis protein CcmI [Dokdonella sp.]